MGEKLILYLTDKKVIVYEQTEITGFHIIYIVM